jgi:hypothetical protein
MTLVVGGSFDRAGDGPLVGAQYERRRSGKVGVGGFADAAFGRDTSTAVGGAVWYHPADGWALFGGPGVAFADGDADVLVRLGSGYAFPAGNARIMPLGWIDLGGHQDVALFLGIGFGFDF